MIYNVVINKSDKGKIKCYDKNLFKVFFPIKKRQYDCESEDTCSDKIKREDDIEDTEIIVSESEEIAEDKSAFVFQEAFDVDSDEEMKNLPDVEGYRSNNFDLGARLWKDLFPEKKVPPCINWIDSYYQGNPNASARAFVHGLELLETCPKDLESHPDTLSDEEREILSYVYYENEYITDKYRETLRKVLNIK